MLKRYRSKKKLEVDQELRELSSSLQEISYEKDFDVPEGFFESQKESILSSSAGLADFLVKESTARGMIKQMIWPIAGIAATLTLLLIANLYSTSNQSELMSSEDLWQEIEIEVIEEYVLDEMEFSNQVWYQELDAAIEPNE